jgi:hypothetical protein
MGAAILVPRARLADVDAPEVWRRPWARASTERKSAQGDGASDDPDGMMEETHERLLALVGEWTGKLSARSEISPERLPAMNLGTPPSERNFS